MCTFLVCVFYRNIIIFSYEPDRFDEGKILLLHNESDSVTATVTAEAVEQVPVWGHRERSGLLRMERTKPHQCRAFP